jgi:hypothetical protein
MHVKQSRKFSNVKVLTTTGAPKKNGLPHSGLFADLTEVSVH